MPSSKPMQWIEQAEARQVMTDAVFRQAPATSRRDLGSARLTAWLHDLPRLAFSYLVPEGPMLQPRPVLARRQARHHRPVRHPGHYR